MGDNLMAVRQAAERWRTAEGAAARARAERDTAIRAAYAAGASVREIAAAAGLSYQRVSQIVAP